MEYIIELPADRSDGRFHHQDKVLLIKQYLVYYLFSLSLTAPMCGDGAPYEYGRCDLIDDTGGLHPESEFRPTLFRTGNSLEGYQNAAKSSVRFAESDFLLAGDGILVSAHDGNLGGTCGAVIDATMEIRDTCTLENGNHPATLADFLAVPLEEWFLDLKNTASGNKTVALAAVDSAIHEVERAGVSDRVVLMIYQAYDEVVAAIDTNGMRAAMKGYPADDTELKGMIDTAARVGFEMVCVNIDYLDQTIIAESAQKGVWHLAWDLRERPLLWRELAEAGLGGVITRNVTCADRAATPYWHSPAD